MQNSEKTPRLLWTPSPEQIAATSLCVFMEQTGHKTYEDLYAFSIVQPDIFWSHVWDFCHIIGDKGEHFFSQSDPQKMETARFFPDAQLNYTENLLRRRDDGIAIIFESESGISRTLTYKALYTQTAVIAEYLKHAGVKPGDTVVGYLPNIPETVIALLATASLGAVWSSCSPDFGVRSVIDRFGQISPKVLFISNGYEYNGKLYGDLASEKTVEALRQSLPSLTHIVGIAHTDLPLPSSIESWGILMAAAQSNAESNVQSKELPEMSFSRFPFAHPLCILFSSGTTGLPKAIIHTAGGTLIQHLKEHQLHSDIQKGDRIFYYTTCGWMMWNWLVSGLATGATLVLYDGAPLYPSPDRLFELVQRYDISFFGTSAKYIDTLLKKEVRIVDNYPLHSLRTIASTGSPLSHEGFEYVYESIKKNVCLSSISGGTDIISCFALGNPIGSVWSGELQTRGLGMRVEIFNEEGRAVIGEKGELVCTAPFPSQPIGFCNDSDGMKYHEAYFSRFPSVWHHGDFAELTEYGGMIIYGRSDTTLNPGGIRIGTAEIYRQVEKMPEITECIVVGQPWKGDVRVVLFVCLVDGQALDQALIDSIKQNIRIHTTPRHVPSLIVQVSDIPKTRNGKRAEIAVRQTLQGEEIKNRDALVNPDVLADFLLSH